MLEQNETFLRDIWYFALPGRLLKPGRMLAKQLLGEPIVFGRTHDGESFALRDICPHRAVPLSCGRFDGAQIECGYHGWKFDRQGQCRLIPALNQDQELDLSKFGVRRYPVREIQGNIWIYMSDSELEDLEPTHPVPTIEGFEGREYRFTLSMIFPCFIDHAIVGLMDPCHIPFVHRSWWWRPDAILTEKSKPFDPYPLVFGFTLISGYQQILPAWKMPGFWTATILLAERVHSTRFDSPFKWFFGSILAIVILLSIGLAHVTAGIFQIPSNSAIVGLLPIAGDNSTQIFDVQELRRGFVDNPKLDSALKQADFIFTNLF
jgi:phenylpropionate dioxygenase-like ring-hydroxylating dioxygenase large terminal subunit